MSRDESHDLETIADLIEACLKIIKFTSAIEESTFHGDSLRSSAVSYQISVLGEAVKRLSSGFRGRYTDIPWQDIAGMRDRLIHAYDDIDLREVWRTSRNDVPLLLEHLRRIQSDLGE